MKGSDANSTKVPATNDSEMRSEYDFSGGVRGKHHNRYIEGAKVIVLDPEPRVVRSAAVDRSREGKKTDFEEGQPHVINSDPGDP